MLFFKTVDGTKESALLEVRADDHKNVDRCVSRWDFKTFADAEAMAVKANELNDGETYIATDAGSNTSPRYDVQSVPKVGALVSKSLNGDSYPCGKIVSVGTGVKRKVVTDTGAVFYRRKLTGSWVIEGGSWYLIAGHVRELNPHF